jgi:hypothetical protein
MIGTPIMPSNYPAMPQPEPLPGWPTEDPYTPVVRGQSPAALYGQQPEHLALHQHLHHHYAPAPPTVGVALVQAGGKAGAQAGLGCGIAAGAVIGIVSVGGVLVALIHSLAAASMSLAVLAAVVGWIVVEVRKALRGGEKAAEAPVRGRRGRR